MLLTISVCIMSDMERRGRGWEHRAGVKSMYLVFRDYWMTLTQFTHVGHQEFNWQALV